MPANILIVEDEPAIQELLAANLVRAGHHVLRAGDAESAQKLVRDTLPDLILLDWMLPGMSGLDFARWLRAGERTRTVPLISSPRAARNWTRWPGWRRVRTTTSQAVFAARTGGARQGRAAAAHPPGDRGCGAGRRTAPGSGDPDSGMIFNMSL